MGMCDHAHHAYVSLWRLHGWLEAAWNRSRNGFGGWALGLVACDSRSV